MCFTVLHILILQIVFLKDVATQVRIQYLGSLLVVCLYLSLGFKGGGVLNQTLGLWLGGGFLLLPVECILGLISLQERKKRKEAEFAW